MRVLYAGVSQARMLDSRAHCHEHWEIILNMEGTGVTIVDGDEFPFYPGMIICHPPGAHHAKNSESPFRDIFIQLESLFPHREGASNASLIFRDDEDRSIETLMRLALSMFVRGDPSSQRLLSSIAETIGHLLLLQIESPRRHPEVERVENAIIEGFTDPEFTAGAAMRRCAYNEDHIRRRFKSETGATPSTYLMELRLDHAMQLLCQPGSTRSVAEVALMSGFYDPLYFSRMFKRRFAVPPSKCGR